MVTVICVTSDVCLAVVVLSADTDHLGLRRSLSGSMAVWLLVVFPARRHPVSCPGPPGQLDNLVLPTLCCRVRSDASVGCSGHAQRHRFGPALRLRQSAVVKRHFPPAKSFIRAGVTTRGHRFQPRIPPGSLYSKPYNLTADRQQSCLPHSSCLPALSS